MIKRVSSLKQAGLIFFFHPSIAKHSNMPEKKKKQPTNNSNKPKQTGNLQLHEARHSTIPRKAQLKGDYMTWQAARCIGVEPKCTMRRLLTSLACSYRFTSPKICLKKVLIARSRHSRRADSHHVLQSNTANISAEATCSYQQHNSRIYTEAFYGET